MIVPITPPAGLLPTALLGALLGLDVVSFPQAMLSRPLVAATLAGALADNLGAGLLIGATLELFALETLPIGASRYPEWGSAAVVGGTLFAVASAATDDATMVPGGLCVATFAALATAWVGGRSMILLRQLNGRLARRHLDDLAAGSSGAVVGLQMFGLVADLLRGLFLALGALLVWLPVQEFLLSHWSTSARESRAVAVGLAATVAAGAVWKLVHAFPRARWLFFGGLATGLLVMQLT